MSECIFCAIVEGTQPSFKLYEDEKTIAILDIFPLANCHTLIIPKNHSENLYDISVEDAAAIGATVSRATKVVKKVLNCDGVSIYQANEKAAGQEIFHVHFHVIPRFEDDSIKIQADRSKLEEDPNLTAQLKEAFTNLQ